LMMQVERSGFTSWSKNQTCLMCSRS